MPGFLDTLKNFVPGEQTLALIASGMETGGLFATGQGQIQYGDDQRAAAEFLAEQLREQAGGAMASAQRRAWSEERTTKYLASKTLAAAAGSGGGASDPTVINLIAHQAAEGSYRQQVAVYEGEDRARTLELQAQAKQYEGASAQASGAAAGRGTMVRGAASLVRGVARARDAESRKTGPPTLLKSMEGGSSLYQRFGGGGPQLRMQSNLEDY